MMRLAKGAGLLFVILSLGFVAERIGSSEIWLMESETLRRLLLALLGCASVYALSGFILATAWRGLILRLGQGSLPWSHGIAVYGRSQIAKYIPGNVFHIIGRHAYGRMLGLGHRPQAIAALLEVILIILAAASLAILGWSLLIADSTDSDYPVLLVALAAIGLLLIALTAKAFLPRIPYLRDLTKNVEGTGFPWKGFWRAYTLYLLFFLVSSAILSILVSAVSGNPWPAYPEKTWLMLVPITAAAWLVGFVTPGASAGIGVREAVLIVLLAPLVGDGDATLTAVSFRLVTVMGDLGFFLGSLLFRDRSSMPSPRIENG